MTVLSIAANTYLSGVDFSIPTESLKFQGPNITSRLAEANSTMRTLGNHYMRVPSTDFQCMIYWIVEQLNRALGSLFEDSIDRAHAAVGEYDRSLKKFFDLCDDSNPHFAFAKHDVHLKCVESIENHHASLLRVIEMCNDDNISTDDYRILRSAAGQLMSVRDNILLRYDPEWRELRDDLVSFDCQRLPLAEL